MIRILSGEYPARILCDVLDIASSTCYYEPRGHDDLTLPSLIEDELLRFPGHGYRRAMPDPPR